MHLIHYTTHVPNFGDDLNLDIWPALAPGLFADGEDGRGFLGIGTILGMPRVSARRIEVFSSGAGYDPIRNWADRDVIYHCVRGPVTAHLCGINPALALTDGALLTPLADGFPQRRGGGGGAIVIPHFQTLIGKGWPQACAEAGMRLIDPRGNTREIVSAIASADLVLTESLHGAILADTYGVPWSAFATSRNFSLSKWIDWTCSVGLELSLTILPPPTPEPLLRFGRRMEGFGTSARFGMEAALSEFSDRTHAIPAQTPWPKWQARDVLLKSPLLQSLLGFSCARTAEALYRLSLKEGYVSRASLRAELTERMAGKLALLERNTAEPCRA